MNFNKNTDRIVSYELFEDTVTIGFPNGDESCSNCPFCQKLNQYQWICSNSNFMGISPYIYPTATNRPNGCSLKKIIKEDKK